MKSRNIKFLFWKKIKKEKVHKFKDHFSVRGQKVNTYLYSYGKYLVDISKNHVDNFEANQVSCNSSYVQLLNLVFEIYVSFAFR